MSIVTLPNFCCCLFNLVPVKSRFFNLHWKGNWFGKVKKSRENFYFTFNFLGFPNQSAIRKKDGATSCIWVDGPADLKFAVFV